MLRDEALTEIAHYLELDAAELIDFADEDDIPGKDDGGDRWATACTTDGQILYALVRAMRPTNVFESGTNDGGSANHILQAMEENHWGHLTTIDINPDSGLFIWETQRCVHKVIDIVEFVKQNHEPFELIFEDASHEIHTVRAVYENLPKLAPGGCVVLSHDIGMGVREWIETGIKDAGFDIRDMLEVVVDNTPGLLVYRYPGIS